jgi:hypothetical protein
MADHRYGDERVSKDQAHGSPFNTEGRQPATMVDFSEESIKPLRPT